MDVSPGTEQAPVEHKERFCEAFVRHMLSQCPSPVFDDGESVAEYAAEVALTYWDDPDLRDLGPEECADSDISYWED
jgi:hypothetical protein